MMSGGSKRVLMSGSESESESEQGRQGKKKKLGARSPEVPTFAKAFGLIIKCTDDIDVANNLSGSGEKTKKRIAGPCRTIKQQLEEVEKAFNMSCEKSKVADVMREMTKISRTQNEKIDNLHKEQMLFQKKQEAQTSKAISYASMAAAKKEDTVKIVGLKKPVPTTKTYKVQVEGLPDPKGKTAMGTELKDLIVKNIKPNEMGFRPSRIFVGRDNKVIIEAKDVGINNLTDKDLADKLHIKVDILGKQLPRMTIFNEPSEIDAKDLEHEIIEGNNLNAGNCTIKPIYKFGPKNRHFVHWVVEVTPTTRKEFLNRRTLYLKWHSCNVEDKIS